MYANLAVSHTVTILSIDMQAGEVCNAAYIAMITAS